MAGGLAHEIRNPLATIRGALDVLEDPEADIGGEFREVMIHEIHRLDRVVGTFLDYARPGTRPSLLKDVGAFVTTCVGALERQGLNDNVFVSVKTEGGLPPITVDADQLEHVIANLILNAYESMDERGVIRVTVRSGGSDPDLADAVEISIQDTGSGMDEETLERAFIPFFTTKDSGTGLGLAICEKLVRGQGGTIQLSSRLAGGTLVRVRLPRCAPGPDGIEDNP